MMSGTTATNESIRLALASDFTFDFPSDSQASWLEKTDFRRLQRMRGPEWRKDDSYNAELDRIAYTVKQVDGQGARVVFMPFVGCQAGVAFRVFPHARLVVGFNNEAPLTDFDKVDGELVNYRGEAFDPTSRRRHKIRYTSTNTKAHNRGSKGWDHYRVLRGTDFLPQILGRMADAIPGFRLQRVLMVDRSEPQFCTKKGHEGPVRPHPSRHGVILFDRGEGTQLHAYAHLDTSLPIGTPLAQVWWLQQLERLRPDAAMVAASMALLSSAHGSHRRLSHWLRRTMRKNKGTLVEGRLGHYGWEVFTRNHVARAHSQEAPAPVTWGYDNRAMVRKFS